MKILKLLRPELLEVYRDWIEYLACDYDCVYTVRIGFGKRQVYQRERERIIVWINGHPQAEFFGADDFDSTGEVFSEIKLHNGFIKHGQL